MSSFGDNDQMRIAQLSLHTSPVAPLGGRETGGMNVYVLELSRELARAGHTIDIFTRRDEDGPTIEVLEPGLSLIRLDVGPATTLDKSDTALLVPKMAREVICFAATERLCYDLVHSHYWQGGRAGTLISRMLGMPHVTMFHTLGEVKNRARISEREPTFRIRHERLVARRADAIVTTSHHERGVLSRYYGADEANMFTIPCGIDIELFYPRGKDASRKALGLDPNYPLLLWVGRIEKLKGVDMLVDAIAELDECAAKLVIVGGDDRTQSQRRELEVQVAEAGLTDRVTFTGAVRHDQLPLYYSAADVVVVPSYYESFGLVAVEAMACGTPVVASRVGGLVSTVIDGVTGYLIPWRCPGPFAEKLEVLIHNPELRANFGRVARTSIERFRWARVASEIARLYEQLIANRADVAGEASHG
ncbi:MAG TPA: glycosyltransferase [Dehalococcoidia bacterium]|nr:glycosyltransferase [Dehalococcoidia bacterium]